MNRKFEEIIENLDEQNIDLFKDSYNSLKNLISKIKEEISPEILESLKEFYINILNHIAEGFKFRLEFIIDTNIIFAEIRAILMGKPSFLLKVIDLPFFKLFAPLKIKEELYNTIINDLPSNLDKEKAFSLANSFINKIEILTQKKSDAWKKAYNLLAEYDKDDVEFLALAISLESHGIITRDKHFKKQKDINVWKLGESGKIASTVSHGALSLYILDIGFNRILLTLTKWIFLFFQSFLEFCHELYTSIKSTCYYFANKYSNLPKWLKIGIPIVVIAIPSLILIFSKKSRNNLKNFFLKLKDKLNISIRRVYNDLKYNFEIIKSLTINLYPFFEFSIDCLGYLLYSANQLFKQIKMLNDQIEFQS